MIKIRQEYIKRSEPHRTRSLPSRGLVETAVQYVFGFREVSVFVYSL